MYVRQWGEFVNEILGVKVENQWNVSVTKYVCFVLSTDGESYSSTQDTPTRAGKSKWTLQRFLPEIHSLSEREDAEWEPVA